MTNRNLNKELIKSLSIAKSENDVENAYRHTFSHYFPSSTTSPSKVDGLIESDNNRILTEFKYKVNLKDKLIKASVLVQVIYYLKRLEKKGIILPNVIFSGDVDECFCMSTGPIYKYMTKNLDWNIAPSSAASKYPEFVTELANDNEISPFVYNINNNLNFDQVIEKIKAIAEGKTFSISITKNNIVQIFKYFQDHVVTDKFLSEKDEIRKISKAADLFYNCLIDSENTFLHPRKNNILTCKGELIKVNSNLYTSFFSHFKQDYTVEELRELTSCKDRIIEEIYRRRTGTFFTPTIWVNEAHKMMTESLGQNWYDEYAVWDCAAGTAQLTRDYNFKELYISTLEQGDIDIIRDMGYNKGATIFQYDFLSEVGIEKVPENLRKCFEKKKKIIFLINPPYGTAAGWTDDFKIGISENIINKLMKNEYLGSSCQQLYAQFIYKICKLRENYNNDITLCIFSSPHFLTGPVFKPFREKIKNYFSIHSGMLFRASNFTDVSGSWGISFSIIKSEKCKNLSGIYDIKEINPETFSIELLGKKHMYSVEDDLSTWAKKKVKGTKTFDAPQMSNSINIVTDQKCMRGRIVNNSIGYILSNSNNIDNNDTNVALFSCCAAKGNGFSIIEQNFMETISLFCARKSISKNWINCKDEYQKPLDEILNTNEYKQWNIDSIVYSLFNGSSQQSSLRQIDYKKQKWNIFNHFFFMSNKEMLELANKYKFTEMYEDARKFNEDRYVYKLLEQVNLSTDAKQVLEYAREMIRKSIELRRIWHEENPEYHLDAWDAGYAQHREVWKKHFKKEFDVFRELYKSFEDRMREGVYKFGFLK